MEIILVKNLQKNYRVYQREAGVWNSIASLINRRYNLIKAVEKVSFEIGEGELVGFIGPNGAGKTTTLKCLAGLLYPTGGEIDILGFTPFEREKEFLKQIAFVMGQKNQLWWDLPPMETFLLNKEIYELNEAEFKNNLHDLVDLLDASDFINVPSRKLSLGQRMRCELIAALLHRPKILFLDEPTIGLDVIMQERIQDFIREYNRHFKSTILLTSHYMGDVEKLCRRVIIIEKGRILYDGLLGEIVKKFADYKLLSVTFSQPVDTQKVSKIGQIRNLDFPQATLMVPRESSNVAAAELLQNFPIADLNIEEPPIEEVIRQIFSTEKQG
ncbi:ATP-binding cassette domain-containing protein [Candidatus Microgenomates bacterium]|nr:ATP-binding cassette domain-containing protein [Candidatus Microgenomates bacterium]